MDLTGSYFQCSFKMRKILREGYRPAPGVNGGVGVGLSDVICVLDAPPPDKPYRPLVNGLA